MSKDEAMEIILANSVECKLMAARMSAKACQARAGWDSKCAGCDRNSKVLTDYGQHKCVCGRRVKKADHLCEACYRDAHPYKRASIQNKSPEFKPQVAAEEIVVAETKSEAVKGCKESKASDRQAKVCKSCGVRTRITARGLGLGCYRRENSAGTLDTNFPTLMPGRVRGAKGKTPKKEAPEAPETIPAITEIVASVSETKAPGDGRWSAATGENLLGDIQEFRDSLKEERSCARPGAMFFAEESNPTMDFLFSPTIVVALRSDRDHALAKRVKETAISQRREFSQHVLYLIEQGLKAVGG